MVEFLKRGRDSQHIASDDAQTRRVVETLLDDVAKRGDAAVRELSIRFDNWDRDDYRLSDREIEACIGHHMTNLAFGGPDNRHLFITESDTGSILRCEAPVPGKTMFSHSD